MHERLAAWGRGAHLSDCLQAATLMRSHLLTRPLEPPPPSDFPLLLDFDELVLPSDLPSDHSNRAVFLHDNLSGLQELAMQATTVFRLKLDT